MDKIKNIIGFLLLSIVFVFGTYFTKTDTVSADEHNNTIVKMYITDRNGKELTPPEIDQWQQFRINADFDLTNSDVKKGDTTVVTIPKVIQFVGTKTFELRDTDGNLVANGEVISGSQIKITYTDYPEKHSDTKGSFFFYVRIDHTIVDTKKDVPIDITVGGKVISAGNIHFLGIGKPSKDDIAKSGWQHSQNPSIGHFYIAVNRSGKEMVGVKIVDTLRDSQLTYLPDTFRVLKGQWNFRNGDWELNNSTDITNQSVITIDRSRFTIQLPNLSENDGVAIYYDVNIPYVPSNGEIFVNDATLTATNRIHSKVQSGYTFLAAGGKAEGYVFEIAVKKTDEDGNPLDNVVFDVIRDRTGQSVGHITTDRQGTGSLGNLLRDGYTLKEIKTPAGYEPIADIRVNPAEFGADSKIVRKHIVNIKKLTSTTIESTTTTETPSTTAESTTTTETPSTTAESTTTTETPSTTVQSSTTTEGSTVVVPVTTTVPPTTRVPQKVLPKTGSSHNILVVVAGFTLFVMGGYLYFSGKER